MIEAVGFRRMSFGAALFLSVLWHLFWISSITIVSFPVKVPLPRFSEISFLGSLLDEPSFEVHVAQRPLSRSQAFPVQEGVKRPPFQEFALPSSKESIGPPGDYLGLKKKNPSLLLSKKETPKKERPSLEGPVVSRTLYYLPGRPELPKWVDPKDVRSNLQLRFWVSPEGKVVSVEKLTSSGDPTVDLVGMRYLRRWQFNPKTPSGDEWGIVTLHFTLPRKE